MIIELAAYRAAKALRTHTTALHGELLCVNWPGTAADAPAAPATAAAALLLTEELQRTELEVLCRDAYGLATQV